MSRAAADKVFRLAGKNNPNFMTPDILRRQMVGRLAVELSTGEGIGRRPIWGVTIINADTLQTDARSTCYYSLGAAEDAIADLAIVH